MVLLYKHFPQIRTALCAAFLLFFTVFLTLSAYAADPIFTVENVTVDVTAENALAAREQAFEEAQVEAFKVLAARMLPESEIATFQPPEPLMISTMIQDFELLNEKLSTVRYIGTYTFRFKDNAVRKYFEQSGTIFSDVSSKSLLVLPFLEYGGKTLLWSPFNTWRLAWNRSENLGGIVPLELPLGDLADVRDIGDNEALSYNPQSLQELMARYGAGEGVIAIAIPDQDLAQISNDTQTAQGNLRVEIYRTDRGTPEMVQQINVTANGTQTKAALFDEAVKKVHQVLQKDWKAKTTIRASQSNRLQVIIPLQSLQQWVEVQNMLSYVSGIDAAEIKALSPRQAVVDLVYQGDEQRLNLTLQQSGMSLTQQMNNDGRMVNILDTGRNVPRPYEQKF